MNMTWFPTKTPTTQIGSFSLPVLALALLAVSIPLQTLADIPATPVMTLYKFNGKVKFPYYDADDFARRGTKTPAGYLNQGSSVIPCLLMRQGKPLTDRKGTPYVGFETVVDSSKAGPDAADRFKSAVAERKRLRVKNHHCPRSVRRVMNVRNLYALNKAPFFDPPSSGSRAKGGSTLDKIVRGFHESRHCERANRALTGRRGALKRAWDSYIAERKGDIPVKTLARAKHLDYTMRTALFEGHLGRGCNAYGACERNVIALSIRNRARGQCLKRQGCRFPGDFQGVASSVSQYNIWDEFLTQISGLTACFLRQDLASSGSNRRSGDYYDKLQTMYTQNVSDVERILYGSDDALRKLFPGNSLHDLGGLRHYYHAPAMGKCFPNHRRVEYMSGAVARKGGDHALIANTRIKVGDKVQGGYRFREFLFAEEEEEDVIDIEDNYPGFVVDARKVRLKGSSGCLPYGVPRGCGFKRIGRYRKAPFWLDAGKPLELECRIKDRGKTCKRSGTTRSVSVGGSCDTQMRPVAHVK